MSTEKYIAVASLGLFVMFVSEIITLYNFMLKPEIEIEPAGKVLQFISIGVAPALILAAISFIMSKRYGSKPIGAMIIAGGAVLLVGMIIANSMLEDLEQIYLVQAVTITPPLFIAVSLPVMGVGALLFSIKKKRPKKEYF